jgi:hypothetical protein
MTDRIPTSFLDPDRVDRVLAPFAAGGGRLGVVVEDLDGTTIAGSAGTGDRVTRDIASNGATVARLVATGPAAESRPCRPRWTRSRSDSASSLTSSTRIPPSELALGRLHQRSIVSLRAPEVPGYDLASHYEAAREIGGDFFELFRLRRRRRTIGVVIADVTGKGIAAGLMMAFARPSSTPRWTPRRARRGPRADQPDPRGGAPHSLFITALVGSLDAGSGRLARRERGP